MTNHPSNGRRRLTIHEKVLKIKSAPPLTGREKYVQAFRDNLRRDAQRSAFANIIHVSGPEGVGKTRFLHRLAEVAREQRALVAYAGREVPTVTKLLYSFARQLARAGASLNSFSTQLDRYRRLAQDLADDPAAPRDWETILTSALLKAGDEREDFLFADEPRLIDPERDAIEFLHQKFPKRDDARLLLEPEAVLSRFWVSDLSARAANRKICLLIDDVKRTGSWLESWLQQLLDDQFGPLDANVVLVLTNEYTALYGDWDHYRDLTLAFPLEPLTEGEAALLTDTDADAQTDQLTTGEMGSIVDPNLISSFHPPVPEAIRPLLDQALERINRQQWEPALALLKDMLKKAPEWSDALLLQCFVFLAMGNKEDALRVLDQAPGSARLLRGFVLMRLHRPEEALAELEQAPARKPVSAAAAYLRGRLFFDLGRFEAALDSYNQALEHHLKNSAVFRHRGRVLYALGRLEAALFSFDRALEYDLENGEIFYWRGIILHDLQRPEVALASFDQALILEPGHAVAYLLRANVLDELGRLPEALADYERALAGQPDLSDAHHRRGKVLLQLNRLPEALDAFDRAIQTDAGNAEKWNDRGNVLRLLGRFDEARRDAEEAVRLDPEFSYAYGTLAEIQAQLGDQAGFFRYIETALDKGCPVWDLLEDPAYAALREDKRLRALLAKHR